MADPEIFGHRRLEIYNLGHELANRVHAMTLKLPYFEEMEEGRQIRRSSKSVTAQIVEGYALRKYRDEFLHYLHRAQGSAEETFEHLKYLREGGSLKDAAEFEFLSAGYRELVPKVACFIQGVERDHSKPFYLRAASPPFQPAKPHTSLPSPTANPRIENQESRIVPDPPGPRDKF